MPLSEQVSYLKSIAAAGCNTGALKPEKFVDWIYWKLGELIANHYMLPYNQKLFGDKLDDLGTYWLEKLPNVSFEETLMSCLEKRPFGKEPGHAKFYYPKKHGYGEVWRRIGDYLKGNIRYNESVKEFDVCMHQIKTQKDSYEAEKILTTIPWNSCKLIANDTFVSDVKKLRHISIAVSYIPDFLETDAHWIYEPSKKIDYHRILIRHNFLPGSKGYWTETNINRCSAQLENSFKNEYAYPVNTVEKPIVLKRMAEYLSGKGIYMLGRWGEHQHYNSDVCVEKAMELADRLEKENENC